MAENETRVLYKALADFSALTRKVREARKEIELLRKEEALLNSQSAAGSTSAAGAKDQMAAATGRSRDAIREEAREASAAQRVMESLTDTVRRSKQAHDQLRDSSGRFTKTNKDSRTELGALQKAFNATLTQGTRLQRGLDKLRNWRPRLTPPFIALIPIIAGVLALVNPLIAGLGAVGAAAVGFAGSLGSIAGAALSAIPGLAALLSMVFALKTAFGGIGSAFKAYTAQKNSSGGGGGGGGGAKKAELTQQEEITRAQEDYRRAVEDVRRAEEDLNEARLDTIRRMKELQKLVDRAAQSAAEARADAQLAQENLADVLADPGSTLGQKLAAQAALDAALNGVIDTLDENASNAEKLREMQAKGIEGDEAVIDAKRRLTDAIDAQRDAQLALQNAISGANKPGGGGGGGGGIDEFQRALDKLSPSARAFVLALIAMEAQWTKLQQTVQEAFFSKIIGQVGDLNKLFPVLTDLLSKAAGAAGNVTSRFIAMITSSKWLADLGIIAENNVGLIEAMGDALLYIIDGLKEIAIAAAPFAQALADGFKKGADNFRDLVASARRDGSLAEWLDTVLGRMQQWWRVIKNIGATIFNFSAAAAPFGQWLTDGLEAMTESWRRASEEARRTGSPWQQYLEDIKPLLTEVRALFGDFFSWFARTSADPENIKAFTDIIATIRNDLGPALSRIFDILSKSGVGQDLVNAIVSIVEALATFLENGGVDGIKAFWNVIAGLADAFRAFIGVIPAPILSLLSSTFGALAALTFVGLSQVLGLLIKLASSSGLSKLLGLLPGLGGLGGIAGGAAGGGVAAGGAAAGGAATGAAAVSLPLVAAIVAIVASQLLLRKASEGAAEATIPNGSDAEKGQLATNIQIAQGLGGSGQGVMALPPGFGKDLDSLKLFKDETNAANTALRTFAKGFHTAAEGQAALDLAQKVAEPTLQENIEKTNEAVTAQQAVVNAIEARRLAIEAQKQALVDATAVEAAALTTMNDSLTVNGAHWDDGSEAAARNKLAILEYAASAQATADQIRQNGGSYDEYKAKLEASRSKIVENIVALGGNRAAAEKLAATIVTIPTQRRFDFQNNIDATRQQIDRLIYDYQGRVIRITISAMGEITYHRGAGANGYSAGGGLVPEYWATGGRAGSVNKPGRGYGMQPRGTDTVPAMLTPGEFVLRRTVVDAIGANNLERLNAGVMSYAQLLQEAMANQARNSKPVKSGSYFDGGGFVSSDAPQFRPDNFDSRFASSSWSSNDESFSVGELNIINPTPEPASDSLPRSIRKLAYVR